MLSEPESKDDLLACETMVYEKNQDTSSVKYVMEDGDEEIWIPVTKRRRYGRRDKAQLDHKTSGSESDLDVDNVRDVHYVK